MSRTRISLIGEQYDCVKSLFEGTILPDGIDHSVTRSPPRSRLPMGQGLSPHPSRRSIAQGQHEAPRGLRRRRSRSQRSPRG